MVVAGIDIGTTHGCVGVWQNGKVNIIANDQGFRTTPAYVCFEGDEVIVGDTAVNKLASHADNTIFHLKRLLGKAHADVKDREFVKEWPFGVTEGADGVAQAETQRNGEKHAVDPVEFMMLLLQNLKDLAEDFTGEKLEHVVINKPAHTDEKYTELLDAAAKKVGVNVLTYLSEPLAAAIAYGLDEAANNDKPEFVLVFDIGGATHDVTLLNADKGLFEVVASKGNDTLGGEDFTAAIFEHCAKSFLRKTKLDVKPNQKASSRLRLACEAAKRSLSTQTQANIEVDSLMEGEDFALKLSRPRFEELINDDVQKTITEIEAILKDNELEKEDIDHVVLVGGSSRIPLVQTLIKKFFENKTLHTQLSPDEAVAFGATIEASCLAELLGSEAPAKPLNMVNVVPLTLSVALANGSVSELIQRDTILPASATEVFTTSSDNQEAAFLQIYEGQRLMAKDNTLVAQLSVAGITPLPKGDAEIDVTFTVSTKGVLTVTASERKAGSKSLEVMHDSTRLTPADVAAVVKKADDAADEDGELLGELEDAEEAEEAAELEAATAEVEPAVPVVPTQDLD
uniref:Heat shock protein 70 n=1 Tax=Hyaloperonospora arabidopsidis (strain Emoy2) TaxID=559515 RepID=M4B6U2_HYAAE